MKFDLIIGNPPYQNLQNKRIPLWQKFIYLSFSILNDDGYFSFINPNNWRKPYHKILRLFQSKTMIYLKMNSAKDGLNDFNAFTKYDYYLIKNKESNILTEIIDENNIKRMVDLKKVDFIANIFSEYLDKIMIKNGDANCKPIHSRSLYEYSRDYINDIKNEEYKYPCVYATSKSGIKYLYSSRDLGHFGIKKMIIGLCTWDNPIYDYGECGVTHNCFAIPCSKKDYMEFRKAINNPELIKIFKAINWAGFAIDWRVFKHFKKDFWREFI
jgi:hypothetical protein